MVSEHFRWERPYHVQEIFILVGVNLRRASVLRRYPHSLGLFLQAHNSANSPPIKTSPEIRGNKNMPPGAHSPSKSQENKETGRGNKPQIWQPRKWLNCTYTGGGTGGSFKCRTICFGSYVHTQNPILNRCKHGYGILWGQEIWILNGTLGEWCVHICVCESHL